MHRSINRQTATRSLKSVLRNHLKIMPLLLLLSLWMPLANAQLAPATNQTTTTAQPPKTLQTRGQTALVQEIVMGPQAYELWQKIQQLIENPELKDFARLVQMFDLQIKEPMDAVNWQTMPGGSRNDIRGKQHNPMIKSGRYGILAGNSTRNYRLVFIDFQFDTNEFCLSKQEIQRLYQTGSESAPTHSPNQNFLDHTGYYHGFSLMEKSGGFNVTPSGCINLFTIGQKIDELKQEQIK